MSARKKNYIETENKKKRFWNQDCVSTWGETMSLFSIRRTRHIVLDFLSLCLSIPLGQTHTEGLVCFWRARNPITFETTSVAPNDSPAGYLIAPTTGTDTEAASHSTVCAVETFPLWLQTVFLHYLMQFYHAEVMVFRIRCPRSRNWRISSTSICNSYAKQDGF